MATQCRVLERLRNAANCVLCTCLILFDVHVLVIACNISWLSFASLSQQRASQNERTAKFTNDILMLGLIHIRLCEFICE
jgi:hypothetical protein